MKIICFYLLIVGFISIHVAQTKAQGIVFNRSYDNDSTNDYGESAIQTLDNGFFFSGSTDYFDSTVFFPMFLIKTDGKGDTEWTKKYSFSWVGVTSTSSGIQLNDSSYIICGTTQDTNEVKPDAFLFKINSKGDSLWLRRYGGTENDYGDGVVQTTDGGFLLVGTTYSFSNGGMDAYLVKTDDMGIMQWDTNYGGIGDDVPDDHALIKTQDGGYAFTGYVYNSGAADGVWLVKLDSSGILEWSKVYGDNGDAGHGLAQTSDGGYIIAAARDEIATPGEYHAYLIKTDNNGILEWQKTFISVELFIGVTQLPDSSYVVAGGTLYDADTASRIDGLLMGISSSGDSAWQKRYSRFGSNNNDYVYDMKPTSDGGFILCGMVTNYGAPTKQDMWLVKTDCVGNDSLWDSVNCPLGVGIEGDPSPAAQGDVVISPNPFSTSATLTINSPLAKGARGLSFTMYDLLGREVERSEIPSGARNLTIHRNNLPAGMYLYKVTEGDAYGMTGKILATGKIIIQ